jgi:hypothetical protein
MSIYDPLRLWLDSLQQPTIQLTFSEIEKILERPLPRSAYKFSAWWGNGSSLKAGHSQARAWTSAGFKTAGVSLARKTVEFHRI